ncbi:MAG: hypothetical protein IT443_03195 [Phycisphaeraceae bacterium]|nr:hypothetical protein [Phycisphaeraceae bacterium]
MRRLLGIGLALGLLIQGGWASAVLSGNLVGGGDFENTSYLVNETSPDAIPPHRFSQTYDMSRWISHWGPPGNPGGLGGFSTYNNPRNLAETGGDGTQTASNLGNMNRSVDPTNANNHIMEAVMFRPSMVQWIAAPANQKPGPMSFSYDFLMDFGYDNTTDLWGRVYVYGMNYLPPNDVTFFRSPAPGAPGATDVYDPALNPDDGAELFHNTYGTWIQGATNGIDPPFQYYNVWQHYDTDEYLNEGDGPIEPDGSPDYQWWGGHLITTELTETFAYYVVAVYPLVYDESDPYFWLYGGKIADEFCFGFDNFELQVSVQIRGDFNDDGVVTLSDINPFKLALADTPAWQAQYPGIPLDLVDPNDDGVITLSDINPFKAILTGSSGAIIPEPATASLLAIGALALIRRR